MRLFPLFPSLLLLTPFLTGCSTTTELTVDYPLDRSAINRINSAGGMATILLADSQAVAASSLRVDSTMAVWLADHWTAVPVADIASITVPDREEEEDRLLKGILYGTAGAAAIALADGLIEGRSNVPGEVVTAAAAGGILSGLWFPQTRWSFVRFSIRPPQEEAERVRRDADRLRLQGAIPGILAELVEENRRYRFEPGFLIGRGNAVSPDGNPSSLFALGGRMSFGYRFWNQGELAFEFSLVSHTFHRSDAREQVARSAFLVTGTFFPFSRSTLFLQAGLGYGFISASGTYTGSLTTNPPVSPPLVGGDGPAAAFGTGIDLTLNERWSLRPAIRYSFIFLGDITLNDSVLLSTGRASHFVAFSLALVFRGI